MNKNASTDTYAPCGEHREAPKTSLADSGGKYTCPMCPRVVCAWPGICPSCGMALEANHPPLREIKYVCPMHPEIETEDPGDCPLCGMPLEPQSIRLGAAEDPELISMLRRLWLGGVLAVPLLFVAGPCPFFSGQIIFYLF